MANENRLHVCRKALINGSTHCNGDNLLTECINWSIELDIPAMTLGFTDKNSIKQVVKEINYKDLKELIQAKPKIADRLVEDSIERD